jgi:type 1 fimbria pilin
MSSKIKAAGLALIAVLAMSAVAAQAASADSLETSGEVHLTGTQVNGITPNKLEITESGATVECESASYAGTAENGDPEITVHPSYSECTNNLTEETEVTVPTGCNLVLEGETTEGEAGAEVECGEGEAIAVDAKEEGVTLAKITVGAQPNAAGIKYLNMTTAGQPMDFTVHATVTGLHWICHGPGCPLVGGTSIGSGTRTGTDADFHSTVTVKCDEDINGNPGNQVDCTINGA